MPSYLAAQMPISVAGPCPERMGSYLAAQLPIPVAGTCPCPERMRLYLAV
jgi:hypothetical protein